MSKLKTKLKSKSKHHDKYKAIQSEEESSLLPKASSESKPSTKMKKKNKRKKRKATSFFSLITNRMFLFFVVSAMSSFLLFIWWLLTIPDIGTPYIVSGILGISIALSGYRHFKQIIGLTKEASKYQENNKKFQREHFKIKQKVDALSKINDELKQTEHRIRRANIKNRTNLLNFREVQSFMKQMDTKDVKVVASKANHIGNRWHDELLRHERDMLHLMFDRVMLFTRCAVLKTHIFAFSSK